MYNISYAPLVTSRRRTHRQVCEQSVENSIRSGTFPIQMKPVVLRHHALDDQFSYQIGPLEDVEKPIENSFITFIRGEKFRELRKRRVHDDVTSFSVFLPLPPS